MYNGPRLALVEGPHDSHVLYHLLKRFEIPVFERNEEDRQDHPGVRIRPFNGIANVGGALKAAVEDVYVQQIAVVVDADDPSQIANEAGRFATLTGSLRSLGYTVPPAAPEDGLVVRRADRPVVGVWVMPDNTSPGMVEDFAMQLVRDGDLLLPHAQQVVRDLPERRFSEAHRSKAELHTWLAWGRNPGLPIGQAIRDHLLSTARPLGKQFGSWLQQVFGPLTAA
ncbi:MAG: hypothetical protein IT204_20675 [Fimbriimonadaceae bacterium]|nr:hypothetical protein [Fimbriimonadaceae bacterium]